MSGERRTVHGYRMDTGTVIQREILRAWKERIWNLQLQYRYRERKGVFEMRGEADMSFYHLLEIVISLIEN